MKSIKKLSVVMAMVLAMTCIASADCTGAVCSDEETSVTVLFEENSSAYVDTGHKLADYMRSVYSVTSKPELDEYVYRAFELFEDNKEKDSSLIVYEGTKEECLELRDYIDVEYGYTYDMRVEAIERAYSSGNVVYLVAFSNTLDADRRIEEYLEEVKKAQAVAESLKTENYDETATNIVMWVRDNLTYEYNRDPNKESNYYYYGAYSGKYVCCGGYATTVYQLCSMDGIEAATLNLYYKGTGHKINTVTFSDGTYYVDAERKSPISKTLWDGYSL